MPTAIGIGYREPGEPWKAATVSNARRVPDIDYLQITLHAIIGVPQKTHKFGYFLVS